MNPLAQATERLRAAGIESARADARILWQYAQGNPDVFGTAISRRIAHEPVAYITGYKEFWSLDFEVGPGVLIPRPETETLIDAVAEELPDRELPYRILDLGTGSACLLVAILAEYPYATGVAVDSSEKALKWARRNVVRFGLEKRAELLNGDWHPAPGAFDVIVSNPPYIPAGDLVTLPPDVRKHEPRAALDGGQDGLSAYRALAPALRAALKPDGVAALEIGIGQSHMVEDIMEGAGFRVTKFVPDLAGIPRCVVLRPLQGGLRVDNKKVGNCAATR